MALRIDTEYECPLCKKKHKYENIQDRLSASVECPECHQPFLTPQVVVPPVGFTVSTASFAQKLFPFLGKFGIGIFGSPVIGSKTIVNHLKGLERHLRGEADEHGTPLEERLDGAGVTEIANRIKDFIDQKFQEAYPDPAQLNPQHITGIQVVGFDSPDDMTGKTYIGQWGVVPKWECQDGLSGTYSGDIRIVNGMLHVWGQFGMVPNAGAFSLQDAVDYAEFLVATTASAQRFAPMIPTVGGEVDVALVTSYAGFQWIQAKALTRQLERPFSN